MNMSYRFAIGIWETVGGQIKFRIYEHIDIDEIELLYDTNFEIETLFEASRDGWSIIGAKGGESMKSQIVFLQKPTTP